MNKFVFLSLLAIWVSGSISTKSYAEDKNINIKEKNKFIVTEVLDGDTLKGVVGCEKYTTIRLADIDCPEFSKKSNGKLSKQAKEWNVEQDEVVKLGKKSKEKLASLLKLYEEHISFVETPEKVCKTGNGDRLVGILYAKDINVNEFMLKEAKCRPFTCNDK